MIEDSTMDQSLIGKEAIVQGRYPPVKRGRFGVVGYRNGDSDEQGVL